MLSAFCQHCVHNLRTHTAGLPKQKRSNIIEPKVWLGCKLSEITYCCGSILRARLFF